MNCGKINFPFKMKSLEQKLAESEAKLEILSSTKLTIDTRFVSISIPPMPKDGNIFDVSNLELVCF